MNSFVQEVKKCYEKWKVEWWKLVVLQPERTEQIGPSAEWSRSWLVSHDCKWHLFLRSVSATERGQVDGRRRQTHVFIIIIVCVCVCGWIGRAGAKDLAYRIKLRHWLRFIRRVSVESSIDWARSWMEREEGAMKKYTNEIQWVGGKAEKQKSLTSKVREWEKLSHHCGQSGIPFGFHSQFSCHRCFLLGKKNPNPIFTPIMSVVIRPHF